MVKYGYSSITDKHIYHEYVCEHCGNCLGAIEIIFTDGYTKERDDLSGWNFCPYCGNELWYKDSYYNN